MHIKVVYTKFSGPTLIEIFSEDVGCFLHTTTCTNLPPQITTMREVDVVEIPDTSINEKLGIPTNANTVMWLLSPNADNEFVDKFVKAIGDIFEYNPTEEIDWVNRLETNGALFP